MQLQLERRIRQLHPVQMTFTFPELHVADRAAVTDPPRQPINQADNKEKDDSYRDDDHVSPVLPFLKLARNTIAEIVTVEVPDRP